MLRFIAYRFLQSIPVMLAIITLTFFMLKSMPGGPFTRERALPPETEKSLNEYFGFNDPLWTQYTRYLANLLPKKFQPEALGTSWDLKEAFGIDFGPSFLYSGRTVNEIIAEKLPASVELGALALGLALAIGLPLGVLSALNRNTWVDYLSGGLSMAGLCIPTFVIGPLLVLIFAVHIGWFPASGWYEPGDRVLPAVTLSCLYIAYIARLTRGGMLEILQQDFIRTARAKGASTARIVFRHALRGGLAPVVSFLGPAAAGILTGSFVVETIFQIPGIGRQFVTSVSDRDYMVVIGLVVVYAIFVVLFNLLVDIAQVWLNPRLRFE